MDLTRLGFMKSSAGAAFGLTSIGALAGAKAAQASPVSAGSRPVVAYVKNPASGTISVISDEREVIIQDHQLAAALSRAAG